jgi:hypothetical protein
LSETKLINLKIRCHGEGKAIVPTVDGKLQNYKEFVMQRNAFAQVEGFSDALMANGHLDMPTDYNTVILDDGQVQRKKQARAKNKMPRKLIITLWYSSLQD